MTPLPKAPDSGAVLLKSSTLKLILDAIQARTPIGGAGFEVQELRQGWFPRLAGADAASTCVLQATVSVVAGDRIFTFLNGGLIGGVLPSNLVDTDGTLYSVNLGSGDLDWIIATVTTASGQITGVTLGADIVPPDPIPTTEGTPPTSFAIPLYAVTATGVIRLFGCANIGLSAKLSYSYEKDTVDCGTWPLNLVWTWEVT